MKNIFRCLLIVICSITFMTPVNACEKHKEKPIAVLKFTGNKTTLPNNDPELDNLLKFLKHNKKQRIVVISTAGISTGDDSLSKEMKTALKRGVEVRKYILEKDQNINTNRITVRVLPDGKAPGTVKIFKDNK